MLDTLRESVSSIWTKILLALLVLMFGVWGIGDVVRNPSAKVTIATVGDATITSDEFLRAMRRQAERIKSIMGDSYSADMLKDPALAHNVLLQLINNTLLRQESEALGLIPSDADVVRHIRANPAFADKKGNFDKALFEGALKNSSTSETTYVNKLRQDMAISLLVDTLTATAPLLDIAPRTVLEAREEERNIFLYTLKPALITNIPAPSDAELKAYYDGHKSEFTAPEYRIASYVTLSPTNLGSDIKVTEKELMAAYNERKEEFKKPEMREVEQLLYASEEKATKASELIKGGKDFEQVAKETDILNKNATALGKIERSKIIETAANTVFSLAKGGVTPPIKSPFGWHIFHVTNLYPPSVSPFEEVKPLLEKDLSQRDADQALNKLANQFQDELAGGSPLAEAAKAYNLKILSVGPIDRQGNTAEKTKSKDIPELDKFIDVLFKTDEKSDSPMATSKGGAYYIMHVDKIIPERLETMDESKISLLAAWKKEVQGKRLAELAKDIGTKFVQAADRNAVIAKYNLQPIKTAKIKRNAHTADDVPLPPALVADIFSRKIQEGSTAYPTGNGDYMLAVLDSILPMLHPKNDLNSALELQNTTKDIESSVKNEILQQYVQVLSKKYAVSINESALQAVLK